jgi:hypothetical protein
MLPPPPPPPPLLPSTFTHLSLSITVSGITEELRKRILQNKEISTRNLWVIFQ